MSGAKPLINSRRLQLPLPSPCYPPANRGYDDELTGLLEAWREGDRGALTQLMGEAQEELHRIASSLFRGERRDHTLQPTAVVHELFLKLEAQKRVQFRHRGDFFAIAARLMRRVLVDHARRYKAGKRGGDAIKMSLEEVNGLSSELPPELMVPELLALDHALLDLEKLSPRQSRIVELRILVGLHLDEIATLENISLSTVSREWKAARLFLLNALSQQ